MDFKFIKAAFEAGAKVQYLYKEEWKDVPEKTGEIYPTHQYRLKPVNPHYDLILAHLSGANIELQCDNSSWLWTKNPDWCESIKYRLKPKTPHKHQETIDAHQNGAKIQWRLCGAAIWADANHPVWNEDHEYRIKPEPHPHSELIKAWADGEVIELYNEGEECWHKINSPSWGQTLKYRIKK